MSNHTIDEKAFQEAVNSLKSSEVHEMHYSIMHQVVGTEEDKALLAKNAVLRAFLQAYLKFKG